MLGGDIEVRSTYGEGSEFELSIRTGALANVYFLRDASELSQRRRSIPMVLAPRLTGRILCAEDNETNRRLVSLLVARTGAELVHVGNGAEALELALRDYFDLILMDIQMPVMNGRDATAALREAGVNTPVIALTANVMAEDIADYRLAGCNEHLAKPIDKQRFYEALARYLEFSPEPVEPPARASRAGFWWLRTARTTVAWWSGCWAGRVWRCWRWPVVRTRCAGPCPSRSIWC
ncbi:response regulator [Marinobacter similis]|uniref:response regulator n=1 Tax=Marinobacter similis TaxID=1420916 RepID=UPI000B223B84|nr:response regulator [Marinobacter similis]